MAQRRCVAVSANGEAVSRPGSVFPLLAAISTRPPITTAPCRLLCAVTHAPSAGSCASSPPGANGQRTSRAPGTLSVYSPTTSAPAAWSTDA